jgi:hypothetical protein
MDSPEGHPLDLEEQEIAHLAIVAAQFESLKETEGYKWIRDFIAAKAHTCAEFGLADGRVEKWRGVREGLLFLEEIIEGTLSKHYNQEQLSELADDDGVDDLIPTPGMHGGEHE